MTRFISLAVIVGLLVGIALLVRRVVDAGSNAVDTAGCGLRPSRSARLCVNGQDSVSSPLTRPPAVSVKDGAFLSDVEGCCVNGEDAATAETTVEVFDALTDKWMEPSKAGVAMKDVDGFVAAFHQVPKERRDECVHRALNLIPDENVMLLAGILMDKSMDKEIVETVFNDILNRDEDVKKPILQQIFKDKTHACWADTAWILDVTGQTSAK